MRIKLLISLLWLPLLLSLTGCFPDWTKQTFAQGCEREQSCWLKWRQNIRSTKVYNGFSTIGLFDALLIPTSSPQTGYVFYVLGYSPYFYDQMFFAQEITQTKTWSVMLQLGAYCYWPTLLQPALLPGKYELAFGKRFNKHKQVYLIGFDLRPSSIVRDRTGQPACPACQARYLDHNESSCASSTNRAKLVTCLVGEKLLSQDLMNLAPAAIYVRLLFKSMQQVTQLNWVPDDYRLCEAARGECEPAEYFFQQPLPLTVVKATCPPATPHHKTKLQSPYTQPWGYGN